MDKEMKEQDELRGLIFKKASEFGWSIADLKKALQSIQGACDWSVRVPETPNFNSRTHYDDLGNPLG